MKALFLFVFAAAAAFAEADLRTAKSPDGQVEFRIFFEPQKDDYIRLAYQIKYKGKLMMDTSYLGVVIHDQPLLGQNAGLISSAERAENGYTHLQTEYMQNGTLGRRVAIDTRVYNDGVAFRYSIPNTGPLNNIVVEDEATEFRFAQDGPAYPLTVKDFQSDYAPSYARRNLTSVGTKELLALPLIAQQPGAGWIAIRESGLEQRYAGLYIRHNADRSFYSTIAPHPDDDSVGVMLVAPFDTPWRVFSLGADAASVINSNLPQRLSNLESHPDTAGWPHVTWTKLQTDLNGTLAGITAKGVVVDTPIRDDQEMLAFYKTVSDAAAKRQLGIEFTGRRRQGTLTLRGDTLEIRK